MGNRDEKWETNLEATETNQSRGEEVRRDRLKAVVIALKGQKHAWDIKNIELSECDD